MLNQYDRTSVRRAVIAVTLSGTAAVGCHNSSTTPDRRDDATERRPEGGAHEPVERAAETTAETTAQPAAPIALPRVVIPTTPDHAVNTPQRIENAVLPSNATGEEGGEAMPVRPMAPPPVLVAPGDEPPPPPVVEDEQSDAGTGATDPLPSEGGAFRPDVVEPRVDPDISACSPIVDGVCPLECTRDNDRDCCEIVGRGGVCSFDAEYGCRCAVIGPFNPPELVA